MQSELHVDMLLEFQGAVRGTIKIRDRTDPIGLTRSRSAADGIRRISFGSRICNLILTQRCIQSAHGPSLERLEESLISASAAGSTLAVKKFFFKEIPRGL